MARPTVSSDALVSSIQSEIQRVQDDLLGVEENLKRLTGRDFNEPRGERRIRQISTGEREDEPPPKRRPPGGVFARLGDLVTDAPPPRGRRVHEVLEDGEIPRPKPSVASSVARPINDGKSRTEAAAELTRDRASRDRNRRMFGALLGTLQRFRTEEAKQKGKDEQRAKIEKKLEEKGRAEKEELRKERIELINQRKERQLRIERLNFKIERVKEHEAWEAGQRRLGKFVRTQSKPRIYWLPKVNNSRTSSLVSQTKHSIERELEEARLRLKDELDEVLGGRGNYTFKADVQERESEIDNDDFNNGSDLLDYDAEEGELVYDDLLLSGKQKQKGMGSERRVVVQVESDMNRAPQRRVELVTVVAERGRRVKDVEGNESEKENVIKSKVNVEHKKVSENGGDKGRGKEKEKKKEREKDKSRPKEKRIDKKVSPEKHQKSHSSSRDHLRKESKSSRKEKKKEEEEIDKIREVESEKLTENQAKVYGETDKSDNEDTDKVTSDANVTNEEENSTHGTEDLSQISLPLDPEPESTQKITEVVVQHVPLNCNEDGQNANEEEMQVETVLIDTSQIKQDKTEWDNNFPPLPIVIKKEKDATPERATEEKRVVSIKPRDENAERKKDDSSSDSSDNDSDSSAESEDDDDDDDDDDSSSEDSSSESSSSSDEEDKKKKRKDKKESSSDEDRKKKRLDKEKESSDDENRKKKRTDKEKESSSDEEERKKKRSDKEKESSSDEEDRKKKRNDQEKESSSDEDRKKKRKEKDKGSRSRRKEDSSSSESSESDDSESDSDSSSEDERKKRKKVVEKRKPSPKYSRKDEREREGDRKKVERRKDARKSSRSRSRSRGKRSRSRDRRRVRSRSRDRRRDRR